MTSEEKVRRRCLFLLSQELQQETRLTARHRIVHFRHSPRSGFDKDEQVPAAALSALKRRNVKARLESCLSCLRRCKYDFFLLISDFRFINPSNIFSETYLFQIWIGCERRGEMRARNENEIIPFYLELETLRCLS